MVKPHFFSWNLKYTKYHLFFGHFIRTNQPAMAHATYDGATGGTKKKAVWYQVELLTEGDGLRFMVVHQRISWHHVSSSGV